MGGSWEHTLVEGQDMSSSETSAERVRESAHHASLHSFVSRLRKNSHSEPVLGFAAITCDNCEGDIAFPKCVVLAHGHRLCCEVYGSKLGVHSRVFFAKSARNFVAGGNW